jgi:hypothetical protein
MTSSSARLYDKPLGLLNVVIVQTGKFCSWLIIYVLKLVGFFFMAIDMDRTCKIEGNLADHLKQYIKFFIYLFSKLTLMRSYKL